MWVNSIREVKTKENTEESRRIWENEISCISGINEYKAGKTVNAKLIPFLILNFTWNNKSDYENTIAVRRHNERVESIINGGEFQ